VSLPSDVGLVLLVWIVLVLPWLALRSRRRLASAGPAAPLPVSRRRIWVSALVVQLLLFLLAWGAGQTYGRRLFDRGDSGPRAWLLGGLALLLLLVQREIYRALLSPRQRAELPIMKWLPRSPGEHALYVTVALAAGVAEEAAYRGVGWEVLSWSLGGGPEAVWGGAALLCVAFALAHATQGPQAVVFVASTAVVMHVLVMLTDTLVVAMVVHAVYDVLAAWLARRGGLPEEEGATVAAPAAAVAATTTTSEAATAARPGVIPGQKSDGART